MATHIVETSDYMEGLLKEYEKKELFENPRNAFKKKFLRKCHAIDTERVRGKGGGCLPGCDEVRSAYQYAKQLLNSLQCQDSALNLKVKRRRGGCYSLQITEELVAWLVQYQSKLADAGVPKDEFATYEQFKIVRVHRRFLDLLPQYR